jgi:hypothetical protein
MLSAATVGAQTQPTSTLQPQQSQAAGVSRAANPTTIEAAAQALAQKIAKQIAPGPIALRFENSTSLNPAEQENFKRELLEQLHAAGIRTVVAQSAAYQVVVTLAENLRGYVFVAQNNAGGNQPAAIVVMPRGVSIPGGGNSVVLRKMPVLDQEMPILDFAIVGSGSAERLVVLENERVVIYLRSGTAWQTEQTLEIAHQHPFPRDIRGRLQMGPDRDHWFAAFLPGTACSSSAVLPLTIECHDADDPWPLSGQDGGGEHAFFNAARNMFTGVVVPALAEQPGRFYSAALLGTGDWVFVADAGAVKELKAGTAAIFDPPDWGTDAVALRSSCGPPNILATGAGDYSVPDNLHSYEWNGAGPALNADPLEFSGPITAIWAAASGTEASVVSRNVKNGRYEAYVVTANCAR